jgi:hypothetical protein
MSRVAIRRKQGDSRKKEDVDNMKDAGRISNVGDGDFVCSRCIKRDS